MLGPSDHKAIAEDLVYAAFWLARMQRRHRNIKISRFFDGDPTIADIRQCYQRGDTTRLYAAYLFTVDPDDVARVTKNIRGYEEWYPEQYKLGLARAEEEVRKAEM